MPIGLDLPSPNNGQPTLLMRYVLSTVSHLKPFLFLLEARSHGYLRSVPPPFTEEVFINCTAVWSVVFLVLETQETKALAAVHQG